MGHVPPKMTIKDLEDFSTILELRENPVYAAQVLLNRDYDPQQALAVWGMWTHPFSMLDWGRGCGKCVTGDTKVKLSDGTYVGIEELFNQQSHFVAYEKQEWWAVMDKPVSVKAYDAAKRRLVNRQVLTVLKQKVSEDLLKIQVSGKSVISTKIHKFLNEDSEWRRAETLKVGDVILGLSAQNKMTRYKIKKIDTIPAGEIEHVYDLSVVGMKNYLANGLFAHNTTMASDVNILSGLLYPGTQSMVVSHSMKGAKLVFNELIKTWSRSPIVQDSTPKRPTKGNDVCEMTFNSINPKTGQQTIILGVAADINNDGSTIRGNRVSRMLHIDEWIILPPDLIDGAVLPCASTTDDPTRPEYDLNLTRFVFTSSSGFTYMAAYNRMEKYRKFFMDPYKYPDEALGPDGKPQYFYHNLNYTKVTKKGILNERNIKMWQATFDVAKFNTEVLAKWESESGSWYNAKDIKGDPENLRDFPGIWVQSKHEPAAEYVEMDLKDKYKYVLAIDPAEMQDETGIALLRVTPQKIYIADTDGYEKTGMDDVAEIIREKIDHFPNIVSIALDPEGGGRSAEKFLKETKVRVNTATDKLEAFFPIYPLDKWIDKDEPPMPPGARQLIKRMSFSSNSDAANLTDWNRTLRTMIKNKNLCVAEDASPEFKARVQILFDQIIAIEAVEIAEKGAQKDNVKQAANKGRYRFTSRILKDRWAALLIGVWEAIIVQAELNVTQEDDDPGAIIIPNMWDDPYGGFY